MISRLLNFIILALFLSFTTFAQTVSVKIIETSDVHGAIFPYS
jgi:2',3'-cyclic-nucleotide 2'-phosphodiesterase (5'-nucleotidase family)